ncbi:MAG: hypothetical protein WDN25_28490 [Acetobacteraceae bacterium]
MPARRSLILALLLAACGAIQPPPDTAYVPPGAFGPLDNDLGAANQSSWAFADAARTANHPVSAARAAAAVDYLAGELSSNPRFVAMSPFTKQEMLQARVDVRRVLGVAPAAPSQVITNALLQFADAWQSGDRTGALQALAAPGFTLPPDQTLRVLANMPFIQSANVATMDAANQMLPGGDGEPL